LLAEDGVERAKNVTVDLTYGHGDDSKYDIKWSVESKPIFTGATSIKGIYIPKEYVLDGKPDVGLAELTTAVTFLPEQPTFCHVSYGDDGSKNLVGRTVVGHGGGVFLRGTVVQSSYSSPGRYDGRILIGTPFISGGSSGCPLFDNSQSLTSLVHGGSKHRASRSFHNNNNDGSDSVVSSGFVYADCISDQTTFSPVPSCYFEHLQAAEGMEDELAAQPEKEDVYSEHASEYLKTVVGSDATTLTEAMIHLHDIIWPQGADDDGITLTSPLKVLHQSDLG
jgi:hypothetical protein